jgi:hypothetical protein
VTDPQSDTAPDHAVQGQNDGPPAPTAAATNSDAPTPGDAVAKTIEDASASQRLDNMLDRFEEALAAGHVKQAGTLHQRLRHDGHVGGGATSIPRRMQRRLLAGERKLRELRGWQRWSTRRARRELIATVEQLVDADLHPSAIAEQIRIARHTWKSWDQAGDPANKPLWHRFDNACTRAYERPKRYFEAQTKARRRNLEAKQAVCAQLETLYEQTDWKHPPWREVDKSLRQIRAQWRKPDPVEHKHRKRLQQRFDAISEKFEDHLQRERRRDRKRREGIIERARQLRESSDTESALHGIKQLQRDWSPTVLATRKEEDRLWQEFRHACDDIFKQRDQQRQALKRSLSDNEDAMQDISQQLDNLVSATADNLIAAQRDLARLTDQWQQITKVPGAAEKRLGKQYRAACRRATLAIEQAQHECNRRELKKLHDKAALCAELECALLTTALNADELAAINQRWQQFELLDAETEAAIARRFDLANRAAAREPSAERTLHEGLQPNLDDKNALCLQLEILAEIESPSEFAKDRMAFQVQRLAAAMGARQTHAEKSDDTATFDQLTRQYWLSGAVPSAQYAMLDARFEHARQAWYAKLSSCST